MCTLVCFAVKEEAESFARLAASAPQIRILVTGMGRRNAERAIRAVLRAQRPALVLTCGFAGGLRPGLPRGSVLFAIDPETGLEAALLASGAREARFHCAPTVVTSAQQKRALWETTGADAVEMESEFIRNLCRHESIPSATLRIVLDAADDELPLDFNELMTEEMRLHPARLALALARSPSKIAALLRLKKQSQAAAESLAQTLVRILL